MNKKHLLYFVYLFIFFTPSLFTMNQEDIIYPNEINLDPPMQIQENNEENEGYFKEIGNILHDHINDEAQENKIRLAHCHQKIITLQKQVSAGEVAVPEKYLNELDKILYDINYGKTIIGDQDKNYLNFASNITQSLLPKIFSGGEIGDIANNAENIIKKAGIPNKAIAAVKHQTFKSATNWIFGLGMSAVAAFSKSSLGVKALVSGGILASVLGITFRNEIARKGKIGLYKARMALAKPHNKQTQENDKNNTNCKLLDPLNKAIQYTKTIKDFSQLQKFITYIDENVKTLNMAHNPLLYVNKNFKKDYLQYEYEGHETNENEKKKAYDHLLLKNYINIDDNDDMQIINKKKEIFTSLVSIIRQKKIYDILLKDIKFSEEMRTIENYEHFFMLEKSLYNTIKKCTDNIKYLGYDGTIKKFTLECIFTEDIMNLFNNDNEKTLLHEINDLNKNNIHPNFLLNSTRPTPQQKNAIIIEQNLPQEINLNDDHKNVRVPDHPLNINEKMEGIINILNCLDSIKPFEAVNNANNTLLDKTPIQFLNNHDHNYLFPLGSINKLESIITKIENAKIYKEDFSPIKNFFSEMFIFFIPHEFKKLFFKGESLYFSNNSLINNIKSCGKSYVTFLLGKQFFEGELKNTVNSFLTHYKKPFLKAFGIILFFPIFYYIYKKINQSTINEKFNQSIENDQHEIDEKLKKIFYTDETFDLSIMKSNITRIVEYILVHISIDQEDNINNNPDVKKDFHDQFAAIITKTNPDLIGKTSLLIDMANIGLSLHFILAQNAKVNKLKEIIHKRGDRIYHNDIERSQHIETWHKEQKILKNKLQKLKFEVTIGMKKNKPKTLFVQNLNTEIEHLKTIIGLPDKDHFFKKIVNFLFNRNKQEDNKKENDLHNCFKKFKKTISDSMKISDNEERKKKLDESFKDLNNIISDFNKDPLNNTVKETIQKLQDSIKGMYAIQYFFANNHLPFFTYKELITRFNYEKQTLLTFRKEHEKKIEEKKEKEKIKFYKQQMKIQMQGVLPWYQHFNKKSMEQNNLKIPVQEIPIEQNNNQINNNVQNNHNNNDKKENIFNNQDIKYPLPPELRLFIKAKKQEPQNTFNPVTRICLFAGWLGKTIFQ